MPPILPRKRLRSDSPNREPAPKRTKTLHPRRSKESVFEALDTPPTVSRTLSQTKKFLEEGDDDESELSEPESDEDEFEDVPIAGNKGKHKAQDAESEESGESEDEEWEDALGTKHHTKYADEPEPIISGDLNLTLTEPTQAVYSLKPNGKKGPSKVQRQIRNVTHCMHVQFLMWSNTLRNAWLQDQEVQRIMVNNLTPGCWREVNKYWRDAGIKEGWERVVEGGWTDETKTKSDGKRKGSEKGIEGGWTEEITEELQGRSKGTWKKSGKKGVRVYESPKINGAGYTKWKEARSSDRKQRDWGATSERLEPDKPNLSAGDPLLRLLAYLGAFWKVKFNITTPCLRKRGYLSPATLQAELLAWKEDASDANAFGERVDNLEAFRTLARKCHGSRDVGQQLFTALLRGLGIEARMVTSLQPVGFGFSQAEEGKAMDLRNLKTKAKTPEADGSAATPSKRVEKGKILTNGTKDIPIDLPDSEVSDLSSAISISSDSEGVTEALKKKSSKVRKYGDELPHPTYWTEAISNLTHTPVVISCLPRPIIAPPSKPDQLQNFYPRGAAADKAKQVFAYLIAYSSDGSAKDVTTRYLPKHQWPGRTKGFRMAAEKIPIHNKRGKVKRWEEWDWFKSVLRPYARPFNKREPWDEVEDEGDLVPVGPAKKKDMDEEGGKETLQGYKNSAEYVLERHLRREEAIKAGAKIVRHFVTGRGDKEKSEPVYHRKDVVVCRSVESWHKEGREVKEGKQPLKYVPMRVVTVIRKREIEERERAEGGKVKQGLYSKAQTDWIIPDPIIDGKIPRNAFGNIDVYVPTMIPKGAVHIPLKGTARICRKMNIDHAEACTGFEFGKQRAVPVLTGVVVAAENEDMVIDAWEVDQAEKQRKEEEKKEKMLLGLWKKFFVGLRTVQRLRREYGEEVELPKTVEKGPKKSEWDTFKDHQNFEGGFVRDESGASAGGGGFVHEPGAASGGFVHEDGDEDEDEDMAGGFVPQSQEEERAYMEAMVIEQGDTDTEPLDSRPRQPAVENGLKTPISLHSMHRKTLDEGDERGEGFRDEAEVASGVSEEEEEDMRKPTTGRRGRGGRRGRTQPTRGRGRGRATERASTSTRNIKSLVRSAPDNSDLSSLSLSPPPSDSATGAESDFDEPPPVRRGKKKATTATGRATPKRKAATKSEKQVKSHFFAHGSDDETDLTDLTDRMSPVKRKRGGVAGGRGRGRDQGRGRAKGKGKG